MLSTARCLLVGAALAGTGALAHKGPGPCDFSQFGCNSWAELIEYPEWARVEGIGGRVTLGVKIDTNGHAFNCTILESSGNDRLDYEACRQFKKVAHFNPALDEQGKPVMGSFCTSINWSFSPNRGREPYRSPLCEAFLAD